MRFCSLSRSRAMRNVTEIRANVYAYLVVVVEVVAILEIGTEIRRRLDHVCVVGWPRQ